MSRYTQLFGGAAVAVGAIVAGQYAGDGNFLPCDGGDYLKSLFPSLDTTNLSTIGSNTVALKTVPSAGQNAVVAVGNTLVMVTAGTAFAQLSTDGGNTWTQKALAATTATYVTLAYGNGAIVLAYTNSTTQVQVSTDGGNTWALKTVGSGGGNWQRVKFAGGLFFLFVDPSSGSPTYAATSADGITWTLRSWGAGQGFIDVAYNANSGAYAFAVQQSSGSPTNIFYFSLDGGVSLNSIVAYRHPSVSFTTNWISIACDGNTWVVVTAIGIYKSTDFFNWTCIGTHQAFGGSGVYNCGSVKYMNGLWWFTPGNTNGVVLCSPDLVKFYRYSGFPTGGIVCADFIPSLGRYVFGCAGSVTSIATLDIDTTKFRTPYAPRVSDADRIYIKVQ